MNIPATPRPADQRADVRFWGVRGSFPVPGHETTVFGGNTSCVELRMGEQTFVLDAGTGIIQLGRALHDAGQRDYTILLTHLHPDHVAGLPFFKPLVCKDSRATLYCGNLGGDTAEAALDQTFAPPLFPVRLGQLPGKLSHIGFSAGMTLRFSDVTVKTMLLDHPSGSTAYRFESGNVTIAYITDVEHRREKPNPDLVRFVEGVDLMVYDAMYTEAEYQSCMGWGHSTWEAGVALCQEAGVKRMAGFHHHPHHDDAFMLDLEAKLDKAMPGSFFAREGTTVRL
jgi:phosphoribosyl 1,2-cyclic phosphodiesterase